jgi:hypothetical protein
MSDEPTALELLKKKKVPTRRSLGDGLVGKVGARGWQRPNVAVSDRLFKHYHVVDPWDPEGKQEKDPIGLGDSALRMGEPKREVAPHLKPPEVGGGALGPGKAAASPGGKPSEVDPLAKWRRPAVKPTGEEAAPTHKPAAAPAGEAGARPPLPTPIPGAPKERKLTPGLFDGSKKPGASGEFGGSKDRPALKGPLPMRPDAPPGKAPPQAPGGAAGGGSARPASAAPAKAPPAPARAVGAPNPAAALPRPPIARPAGVGGGASGGRAAGPASGANTGSGRFGARNQVRSLSVEDVEPEIREVTLAPVGTSPPPMSESASEAPAPAKVEPAKVIERRIPTGPIGLDDIFGGSSEGRIRRPKKGEGK